MQQETGSDRGLEQVGDTPVSGVVVLTLREAVKAGALGKLGLAGARTARHRDPAFPSPVNRDGTAEMYSLQALADWAARRDR